MSIKVNQPEVVQVRPTFEPKELVISNRGNGNLYLVIGPGDDHRTFEGVRLEGTGRFETSTSYLRECVDLFHGEVVIKND